ncbi:hypothetical protein BH11ARM2_BH11ARM2_31880 [soil metagenome]
MFGVPSTIFISVKVKVLAWALETAVAKRAATMS